MPSPWTPQFDSSVGNTAQACKAAGGLLGGITVENPNTTQIFIQVFNALAADVTVGSTTPVFVFPIPAGDGTNSGIFAEFFGEGIQLTAGITYTATTTATGAGAPTTALKMSLLYK